MAKLLSIQIGRPEDLQPVAGEPSDKPWRTAFFKQPVAGPVRVGPLGLEGDRVADTSVHGGPDKAVCVYPADHWPFWREELGLGDGFGPAAFGENFSVTGLDESAVCLGDRWRVGDALFEVSQPRQPCWKLARRWGVKDLALRVQQNGRTGWYLRVLTEGAVRAGDPIERLTSPLPEWPLARCNEVMHHRKDDPAAAAELAAVEPLAESWKKQLRRRLG